jgi:hypothetical protein
MTVIVVIVAVALIVLRNSRPRKMSVMRLWIAPAIFVLLTGFVLWTSLIAAPGNFWLGALASAIGIVAGIPLGFARGHHSDVRLGDKPGTIVLHPSLVVMLIWLAAFAVRYGLRSVLPNAGPAALAISDGFLLFAVSSIVTANVMIFRKYEALRVAQA